MLSAGDILDYTREAAVLKSNIYSITLYESTGREKQEETCDSHHPDDSQLQQQAPEPAAAREWHVAL